MAIGLLRSPRCHKHRRGTCWRVWRAIFVPQRRKSHQIFKGWPYYRKPHQENILKSHKILFVLQFWYIIAVALVKFSILCLYGRVFGVGRFPTSVLVLLAISAAWLISFLFATLFQVWPLWCNWIACIPTTNYPVMYVLSSATDIVIDISILALPAFFIRSLHLSGNQKIAISGIFGLGIL